MKRNISLIICAFCLLSAATGCSKSGGDAKHRENRRASAAKTAVKAPVDQTDRNEPQKQRAKSNGGAASKNINVVWIVIDALRADHLGVYGYDKPTSPFLDEFARSNVLFKRAISQESYTQASVPSLLTSTYPIVHGVLYDDPRIDVLAPEFLTAAEILAGQGYVTAAFVFNPHLQSRYGFGQGFDLYDDNSNIQLKRFPMYKWHETARRIHDKTEAYLKKHAERPVFLYLHYRDVHNPYVPPPPYHATFLPKGFKPRIDILYPPTHRKKYHNVKENAELFISQYDGEIRYTDDRIRELFDMLAQNRVDRSNTVFIVTSDHGEEFFDPHPNDPGYHTHGRTLYGEQIHVPLMISLPKNKITQAAVEPYVELVDVLPTVVQYLGLDPKTFGQFDGESLLPLIENGAATPGIAYSGGCHGRGVIIKDGWKYYRQDEKLRRNRVRNFKQPKDGSRYSFAAELFDLKSDEGESTNRIEIDKAIATELARLLEDKEAELRKKRVDHGSAVVDEETRARLEALGYLSNTD